VVVLKGVLNESCLATLAEGVDAGIENPTSEAAFNKAMKLPLPREGGFLRDYYTYKSNRHISKFIFQSPCAHLAAQILKSRQVNLLYDQLFVKEVLYDSVTPWHQDQSYYAVEGKQIGSTWVPLDVVPHKASMLYLCGSHTWGTGRDWLPTRFIQNAEKYSGFTGSMKPLPDIDKLIIRSSDESDPGLVGQFKYDSKFWDVRTFEVMPGDVLLFHGACLHAAPGNPSNLNRRRALAIRWVGDDCVWLEKEDPAHQIPNTPTAANLPRDLKTGDPLRLDNVAFPRGWPRT
jgi:ectoine hydroxylase-related dioxygenase (phytanoyl-CoA dioxygenase family)